MRPLNFTRKLIQTSLVAAALTPAFGQFFPGPCITGSTTTGISPCASESTSWLGKLTADLSYAKQLLQYAIQVQQLADAIKNTAHGGPNALSAVATDLAGLANVVQGGRALAYSLANQDVLFAQTYPGYVGYIPPGSSGVAPGGSYAAQYSMWAQSSLNTTQGVLRGIAMHGSVLNTEMGILQVLRTLASSNLLNRNDAINLTSQLASEQVAQLQKLRALEMAQMTSVNAFQGYEIQRDSAAVATTANYFSIGPVTSGERPYSLFPGN